MVLPDIIYGLHSIHLSGVLSKHIVVCVTLTKLFIRKTKQATTFVLTV